MATEKQKTKVKNTWKKSQKNSHRRMTTPLEEKGTQRPTEKKVEEWDKEREGG
jgi:hypothetical protein